jgi:ATP-dependent HslUV protease ATP-binding subunit HslU
MTQTEISQSRTPKEIVEELDKYIIGQNAAKRAVAIALRNRWRRQSVKTDIRDEIMPNNIIMIGPTGVGKTEIARRLAKLAGAPFVKVEATKFTEVGYVGRDVESIVRDLAEAAVNMVRAEKSAEVQIQAKNAAINRVLDALIPPLKRGPSFDTASDEDIEMNSKTRDKFREMILDGALNERQIEIDITVDPSSSLHVLGPMGMDEMTSNIQEMLGSMMPKKSKTRKVTVAEALVLCEKEESEKLIDMDKVTREAIRRAENTGIVFIDEIDKVASGSGDGHGPSVSREGVQRDLLPIVEGSAVNTKHGVVKTDHVLFIASGAFHVSKPSDLIPELQGRFPIRVELQSLTEEDFINILTVPQNALIKQYKALLETENIVLEFDPSAIKEIAATAARVNDDVANIGARRLHTILTTLLDEIMFDATAATMSHQTITIDDSYVKDKLSQIAGNTDVSKYIL